MLKVPTQLLHRTRIGPVGLLAALQAVRYNQQYKHHAKQHSRKHRSYYHCEENSELWIQRDDIAIHEDELLFAFLLRHQHDVDLLGSHRQDGQFDPVELVEATPGTGLCQALEDAAETSEVHLIGTVKDDDVLAQSLAHVLCRLRLARSGGSGWGTPQRHAERLGQGDVTSGRRRELRQESFNELRTVSFLL